MDPRSTGTLFAFEAPPQIVSDEQENETRQGELKIHQKRIEIHLWIAGYGGNIWYEMEN